MTDNLQSQDESTGTSANLTADQYNRLMAMLDAQTLNKDSDSGTEFTGNALLAGNFCLLSTININQWILDSGASEHMCSSLDLFDNYTPLVAPSAITIPDDTKINITHTGTIKLNHSLILKNVLFILSHFYS